MTCGCPRTECRGASPVLKKQLSSLARHGKSFKLLGESGEVVRVVRWWSRYVQGFFAAVLGSMFDIENTGIFAYVCRCQWFDSPLAQELTCAVAHAFGGAGLGANQFATAIRASVVNIASSVGLFLSHPLASFWCDAWK